MNVNFGLFPPLAQTPPRQSLGDGRYSEKTIARKRALTSRALDDLSEWLSGQSRAAAE